MNNPSSLIRTLTITCKACGLAIPENDSIYLSQAEHVVLRRTEGKYLVHCTSTPQFTTCTVDASYFVERLGLLSPLRPDIVIACSPDCFQAYVHSFAVMVESGALENLLNSICRANEPLQQISIDDASVLRDGGDEIDIASVLSEMASLSHEFASIGGTCAALPTSTHPVTHRVMPVDVPSIWSEFSSEMGETWGSLFDDAPYEDFDVNTMGDP